MKPNVLMAAAAVLLCAAPAVAELPEPAVNEGATRVTVEGTHVSAEAWALAHGHAVDAVIVTRIVQQPEGPPRVETYERWSRDGRTHQQRGDRALGRAWEKLLWEALEEGVQGRKPRRRQRELMDRAQRLLPPEGSRRVGAWMLGWSVGEALSEGSGGRSVARIALFTVTPAAPRPATPRQPPRGKPVTPGSKRTRGTPNGSKDDPGTDMPDERPVAPVTPGPAERRLPPWWPPTGRAPAAGSSGISSSALVEGSASSETGARKHARMSVDLGALLPKPVPPSDEPEKPTTPRKR